MKNIENNKNSELKDIAEFFQTEDGQEEDSKEVEELINELSKQCKTN